MLYLKLYTSTVAADQNALAYTQAQYETGVGDKISVIEAQNTLQSATVRGHQSRHFTGAV